MEDTHALVRLPKSHQQALQQLDTDLQGVIQHPQFRQRFLGVLATQIQNNAALMDCTPDSLCAAIVRMAQLNLDPAVPNEAWIVPYRNKDTGKPDATFQTGYAGKRKLVLNHPEVLDVYAERVCKGETFLWHGPHARPEHEFAADVWGERGETLGFYAVAILRDKSGVERYRALKMSVKEMKAHAQKYSRNAQKQIWTKNFDEMGIVSALRLLCTPKYLPMTTEAYDQLKREDVLMGVEHENPADEAIRIVRDERLDGEELQDKAKQNIANLYGDNIDPDALNGTRQASPVTDTVGSILQEIAGYCRTTKQPLQEFWAPLLRCHQVTQAKEIPLAHLQQIRDALGKPQAADTPPSGDADADDAPPLTLEGDALTTALADERKALFDDQSDYGQRHFAGVSEWLVQAQQGPLSGEELEKANAALLASQEYRAAQVGSRHD